MDYLQLTHNGRPSDMNIIIILVTAAVILVFVTALVYKKIVHHYVSPVLIYEAFFVIILLLPCLAFDVFILPLSDTNASMIGSAYGMTLDGAHKNISLGSYTTDKFDNESESSFGIPTAYAIKHASAGTYTATLQRDDGKSIMMKITIDKSKRMKVFTTDNTNGEPSWKLITPKTTATAGKE
jgi:hypothetical protein